MRKHQIVILLAAMLAVPNLHAAKTNGASATPDSNMQMKLWKNIDISSYKGTFPCLGDLDNDGKVDFLLYRQGPQTTPGYMVALNHEGKRLWEMGDPSRYIVTQTVSGQWKMGTGTVGKPKTLVKTSP